VTTGELTPEMSARRHVLYSPRSIRIDIMLGCEEKLIAPYRRGEFSIALLGSADLNVAEIEVSSLRFHGATPVRTEMSDVDGDGTLDLVMVFDQASVKLHSEAKRARLSGWLKNTQLFIGEDRISVGY